MQQREVIPFPQKLRLKLALPGSKSITNRALLCAMLAGPKSRVTGLLTSDDTEVMRRALRQLKLKEGKITLDLNNAGTATRFLTAIACLRKGQTLITGNRRMQERPIADLVKALSDLGAKIEYKKTKGCPPIQILKPIPITDQKEYEVKLKGDSSSQYLSALLMMAPLLSRPLRIHIVGKLVSKPYIRTTLAVMKAFGVSVQNKNDKTFLIKPQKYKPCTYKIEGDASAATYFSAMNFLHGGKLVFENLNYKKSIQGDVDFPKALKKLGSTINMESMPDAAMTLAVVATLSKKSTLITGLSTLKIKETDRLKALKTELKKVGANVKTTKDSIAIHSQAIRKLSAINSSSIRTYSDHRMAMCFAVLGTKIEGVTIQDPDCVNKTYPNFWIDLERAYLSPLKLGKKHLVLTGMRGAGKTFLGQKIARYLKRPFVDIDREIEKDQKMNITEIVKKKGWDYFRKVEQKICSIVMNLEENAKKPMVIATGGGVVLNPKNMAHFKKNAVNVFIFADPAILTHRVMSGANRPPLKPGMSAEDEIIHLWQARRPLYLKYADVVWDNTSGKMVEKYLGVIFN